MTIVVAAAAGAAGRCRRTAKPTLVDAVMRDREIRIEIGDINAEREKERESELEIKKRPTSCA